MTDNVWSAHASARDVRYSENTGGAAVWISIEMKDSEAYTEIKLMHDELHLLGRFYRRGHVLDFRKDSIEDNRRNKFSITTISHAGVAFAIG